MHDVKEWLKHCRSGLNILGKKKHSSYYSVGEDFL